jgi:Mrp family chromosome partitioning ATPase
MTLGFPLVLVVGSKGGVGTTTLAAGLVHVAADQGLPVACVDLTATNDLARALDRRAVSVSSLVRHRGRMPSLVGKALRRKTALLALDLEATMYADRLSELLRILIARRPVVVDAGSAFATTGGRPLAPYLSLATCVVLAIVPDVRAVTRAEHLLRNWTAHEQKVVLVENMAGDALVVSGATAVPLASTGSLERLLKEPAGDAIRALATELLSPQEVVGKVAQGKQAREKGILRSLLSRPSPGS